MAPQDFIKDPMHFLRMVSQSKSSRFAMPQFGFSYCLKKYNAKALKDVDLSRVSCIINGAEPIHIEEMDKFIQTFSAHGLRQDVVCPAYGLAEATLWVSGEFYTPKSR